MAAAFLTANKNKALTTCHRLPYKENHISLHSLKADIILALVEMRVVKGSTNGKLSETKLFLEAENLELFQYA